MDLGNRYGCVGRVGRWLDGPAGGWEERVRAEAGRVSGERGGCGMTDRRGPGGRTQVRRCRVSHFLTGKKLPTGKALTRSPADELRTALETGARVVTTKRPSERKAPSGGSQVGPDVH